MNIIKAIEGEFVAVWHIVETDAASFGALVWKDAQPVLLQVQGELYADLKAVIVGLLAAFKGKDPATIETALLNVLSAAESTLLARAAALGSTLLQLLIADLQAAA